MDGPNVQWDVLNNQDDDSANANHQDTIEDEEEANQSLPQTKVWHVVAHSIPVIVLQSTVKVNFELGNFGLV